MITPANYGHACMNHFASKQQGVASGNSSSTSTGRSWVGGGDDRTRAASSHINIQTSALDLLHREKILQGDSGSKPLSHSTSSAKGGVSDAQVCVACARAFFRTTFDATGEVYRVKSFEVRRRERLLGSWRTYLDVVACCTIRMMQRRLGML